MKTDGPLLGNIHSPGLAVSAPMNIVVTGGYGGIGSALLHEIRLRHPDAYLVAVVRARSAGDESPSLPVDRVCTADISSEVDVQRLAVDLAPLGSLHWVINAVGMLHASGVLPEKTIQRFDPVFFAENFRINTLPTLLLAAHLGPLFEQVDRAVFATISARIGSIGENRLGGWYSYRCSKAALNQALKTLSIEWKRSYPGVCVAALHPGTTATRLSLPFQSSVPERSLFSANTSARYLVDVIAGLKPDQSGEFWSFDGQRLPW